MSESSNLLPSQWDQDLSPIDADPPRYWEDDYEDLASFALNDNTTSNGTGAMIGLDLEQCSRIFANATEELSEKHPEGFCSTAFDTISCWPPTPYNSTAVIKCFSQLFGIKYDDTQNATRFCLSNGTWARTNYSACTEIIDRTDGVAEITTTKIYIIGYTISLITLAVAVGIFVYFKELRCLRNTIHINLMCAYMLMYIMWIKTTLILLQLNTTPGGTTSKNTTVVCIFLTTILHYFHLATFFWMFVEGLYLYILVVETLTRENFKLRVYATIGWGLPIIFVTIWAVVKYFLPIDPKLGPTRSWMKAHPVDWIHQTPTVIVLLLNLVFLLAIMWVLITKLRSANSWETQQYRKAAKALLVLMPLLGVTYIITLYGPTNELFDYGRAVLLSTQGFSVAFFFCFLNTEVQNTLKHHFETWRTNRSLGPSRFRSSRSKDWSPRSRTESIRLYSHPTGANNKRESSASEMTTTTLIAATTANGGTARSSAASANGGRTPFLQPPRCDYSTGSV